MTIKNLSLVLSQDKKTVNVVATKEEVLGTFKIEDIYKMVYAADNKRKSKDTKTTSKQEKKHA